MTHGPEHHIEHAEHAAHASHDEFNKQVTISIAIVAAVLACVTMLGHRAHNDTLRLQGEALTLQTQASIKSTDAANKWAYYQSKNIFNLESEITLDLLKVVTTREDRKKELDSLVKRYGSNVKKYKGDGASASEEAKKSAAKGKLAEIMEEAEGLSKDSERIMKEAEAKIDESHLVHQKGDRFDLGELGLQFGVVLCSLAILTKGRGLWIIGLIASAIGAAVAMSGQFGLFLGHH